MTVLDRSELQASPLSDLHLIAGQVGVEGFRRLRKAELIDAILSHQAGDGEGEISSADEEEQRSTRPRRSRAGRSSRGAGSATSGSPTAGSPIVGSPTADSPTSDSPTKGRERGGAERGGDARKSLATSRTRRGRSEHEPQPDELGAEGIVEILGNGSAFLRVHPPESSEQDVYISAAQVRRCELVSGDRVSGPVRTPRRSERYPSLIRIETINGESADSVVEGTRYEELPVSWPSERIAFDSQDPTLQAIEWLTPIGRGSRAVIVGSARSGKTETLRRILAALASREGSEPMLALSGVRPEEIGGWQEGPVAPLAALSFAASADAQGQAIEGVVETAKRLAARGGHALVLIDSLDGLHPHVARRVLSAARNLRDGGSLTIIATASRPFGGETTVIALDVANASTGRFPALDLLGSGALRAELLVGEDGAQAITRARASAAES
jgi:transcription termination factor Rho